MKIPKFQIKLPSNEIILYAVALGGALTFAYSFMYLDARATGFIWWLLLGRGLILGGAAGLGMAKVAHSLPRIKSPSIQRYALWSFIAFLIVAPLIVSPVVYSSMNLVLVGEITDWFRWVVSIAVGLFMDIVTISVALTSSNLEAEAAHPATASVPVPAKKPAKEPAVAKFFCKVAGCPGNPKTPDGSFGSQAALNAHGSAHKPAIVGYEVSMTPVVKGKQ